MSDERLVDLALSLTDGTPIDWTAVYQSCSPDERRIAERLEQIELVARANERLPGFDSAAMLPPGVLWGPLEVQEHIGSGSYGDVYRAYDPRIGRTVALKLLRDDWPQGGDDARILEAHLLGRIRHQNVVTVYGADRINGRAGIWMEFVEGATLADQVRRNGPFTIDDAVQLGLALLDAVAAIHSAGLLHRDIKAQNVMLDASGRCVLMDLGAGRDRAEPGHYGPLAGTPAYLAPEVLGGAPATPPSDLYAVGVLLFYLLTGRFPVTGRDLPEIAEAHRNGDLVSLSTMRPDAPPALTRTIDRALRPDPTDRFADAAAMRRALSAAVPQARARQSGAGRSVRMLAAGALLTFLSVGAFNLDRVWSRSDFVELPFEARDWVLVTHIENVTGNPTLDGTLDYVFTRELAASSFVNVVPRERVDDVLRLMLKPVDVELDARIGREVALRDGHIRALVHGRIERLGDQYLLSANLVRPADGAAAATVTESAQNLTELVPAVRRVAFRVRALLGETLASLEKSQAELQKVTTPSLRALQLYSKAAILTRIDGPSPNAGAAEQLLREAITEDPSFASAHLLLAYVSHLQGKPVAQVVAHMDAAVARSDHVTEIERLFINALSLKFRALGTPDPDERVRLHERAAATYEALLRLQPDHYWALERLGWTYDALRRYSEAARVYLQLSETRPKTGIWTAYAAWSLFLSGASEEATRVAAQAGVRVTAADIETDPGVTTSLGLLPAHDAWVRRDAPSMLRVIQGHAGTIDKVSPAARDELCMQLVHLFLAIGRLDDAEVLSGYIQDTLWEVQARATVERMRGGKRLREYLAPLPADLTVRVPNLLLDAGLVTRAREWRKARADTHPLVLARLALAEGRLDDAISGLSNLTRRYSPSERWAATHLHAARTLADALVRRGDLPQAIATLETASRLPLEEISVGWSGAHEWMLMRDRLSELYSQAGRLEEVAKVDSDLLLVLAVADEDHPIRVAVRQRRVTRSSTP